MSPFLTGSGAKHFAWENGKGSQHGAIHCAKFSKWPQTERSRQTDLTDEIKIVLRTLYTTCDKTVKLETYVHNKQTLKQETLCKY